MKGATKILYPLRLSIFAWLAMTPTNPKTCCV